MHRDIDLPKILFLVDDDHDDQEVFLEALRAIDTSIVCYTAKDGRDALHQLQEALILPDVLFVDLNMPIMSGKELLKALKKEKSLQSIPVIVYSTSSAEKEKDNCIELGAVSYISKPTQFKTLVTTLTNTLQEIRRN